MQLFCIFANLPRPTACLHLRIFLLFNQRTNLGQISTVPSKLASGILPGLVKTREPAVSTLYPIILVA